jgi:site-specific DNA-cytosine methylase
MIKVLELFSGTRSIGKVCDQLGWDSVSVDLILPADHQVDIMDFDYKQFPKDYFDIVWASPPCTNYSNLKKCWYGKKLKDGTIYNKELNKKDQDDADKLVLKSLEIINYFNPEYWFIENPQTGNLKNREIMINIPFYDVDYCMYSDWGYKKRTRIWTNKKDWSNLLCTGKCGNMLDNRKHKKAIGIGKKQFDAGQVIVKGGATNRLERYRIPEDLIFSLFLE